MHKGIHPDTDTEVQVLGTPAYTNYRDLRNTDGSTGIISGGVITDGGAGTIDVSAIEFFVRSTNDVLGELVSAALAAATGETLTDDSLNYVYASYNGGTPAIVVSATPLADIVTNVIIGVVYRGGTELHITTVNIPTSQVEQQLSRRLTFVEGIVRQSGGAVSEIGVLNMAITAGDFWLGLTEYAVPAIDTSAADTFQSYWQDGVGGFTSPPAPQQAIDNNNYDDGSGTLATLGNSKYGVHWVYRGLDGDTYVIYGTDSYSLSDAQNAPTPSALPPQITIYHGVLLAKIIVQKGAVVFAEIQSAFETTFAQGTPTSHSDLGDLDADDHPQYQTKSQTLALILALG